MSFERVADPIKQRVKRNTADPFVSLVTRVGQRAVARGGAHCVADVVETNRVGRVPAGRGAVLRACACIQNMSDVHMRTTYKNMSDAHMRKRAPCCQLGVPAGRGR